MQRVMILLAGLAAAAASGAHAADDRTLLNHCKALVAQASATDGAEVQRCRQVIKEWTLRDSRMSVDENGRPLR
jgi:hypothetical protein